MALIDQKHPFFQPLWRRIAIVALVAAWLCFEVLYTHDTLWLSAPAAILAYRVWRFIISWPKSP